MTRRVRSSRKCARGRCGWRPTNEAVDWSWRQPLDSLCAPSRAFAQDNGDNGVEELDSAPDANHGAEELNLIVGENKTISALGVKNYSEGAHGVADIKLTTDGSKFVVVGRKPGTTSLLLINKDGTQTKWVINVFTRSPDSVKREVEQLLQDTPGVRVRRVGSRFFIEGGVATKGDAERIQRIADLYPGQVESLVVAGSGAADRKINIRVDFFFVQYDKSSGYAVGMDFPGRFGGDVIQSRVTYDFLQGATTEATASVVNQPLPGLDLAARKGWAKVLKQSTVITVNGTQASFENGGEQNYPISCRAQRDDPADQLRYQGDGSAAPGPEDRRPGSAD